MQTEISRQTNDEILISLLTQTAAGSSIAFSAIYLRTNHHLLKLAIRITRRRELAEEVLQEAYLNIWKAAGLYDRARGQPMSWLFTVVQNAAVTVLRRESRMALAVDFEMETVAADGDPLSDLLIAETEAQFTAALASLPSHKRDLLIAAYVEGSSRATIAQRLNVPIPTVKTWLHRAVNELRSVSTSNARRPVSPSDRHARRPPGLKSTTRRRNCPALTAPNQSLAE